MKPARKVVCSEAKEQQILEAAGGVFLELGFDGASTDEIARRAKVSKATLYGYFLDKRALFLAYMQKAVEANRIELFVPHGEQPLPETLRQIGGALLKLLLSPPAQELFRMAIAESTRFPELGQALYRSGQEQGKQQIAAILRRADADGDAQVPDPDLAAAQFIELCRADLFYRVVFGVAKRPKKADILRIVEEAVETFMARYGVGATPAGARRVAAEQPG